MSWISPVIPSAWGTISRSGYCMHHTHNSSGLLTSLRPHKLSLNGSRLAPENTCDVPISTSHLSFAAPHVTKSFAACFLPRTQFDQWLGHSVGDKLQPWSCRTPPVPTSSNPFDQWLQLSFSHACLVVPSSPCVCHSRFHSTVLSAWH